MSTSSKRLLNIAALGLCVALSGPAVAQKLYKWVDKDGNVFYSDQVPPDSKEYARERLNDQGVVVDEVERAKTAEEIAAEKRAIKLVQEALEQEARQREKDQIVISSYTSEEDIFRQRDNQLTSIERLIDMTKAAMKSEEQSLNHLVSRAAELERKGRPVTDALRSQIENMRSRIMTQRTLIGKHQFEKASIESNFQTELSRYREVMGRLQSNS